MERCGWEARTSRPAVHRHLKMGANFDLATGCDLNDESRRKAMERHVRKNVPSWPTVPPDAGTEVAGLR
eukprot:2024806-Pyramimonas_sp.AAC.1